MERLPGIRESVRNAAGVGGFGMTAMTADAGNPFINLAVGATVGAGVGLVQGVRNTIKNRKAEFHDAHAKARQEPSFETQASWANDLGR